MENHLGDVLITSFKEKLIGSRVDFYMDDSENLPMVCFADLVTSLIRNPDPEKIIEWENQIMEEDMWYARRDCYDGTEGVVFLTMEHCGDAIERFLDSTNVLDWFKEWKQRVYRELDNMKKRKRQRKGKNSNSQNSNVKQKRRKDANWTAFVHNRKRRNTRQQDNDDEYRPSPEDDDAWALDALAEAMSEEEKENNNDGDGDENQLSFNIVTGYDSIEGVEIPDGDNNNNDQNDGAVLAPDSQPQESQSNHLSFVEVNNMEWKDKKDFISFNMKTIKELRELWTTFKDVDLQIAGTCMTMITNSLRAVEPYWPPQHTQPTSHRFVDDQDDPKDPYVSISQRLSRFGYDPSEIEVEKFKHIGAVAARLYENEYGTRPDTIHRQYEGQWRTVNRYKRSRARKTIDVAIKRILG